MSDEAMKDRAVRDRVGWVAPLVVAATFAGGFAHFVGWPAWPVANAHDRIAYGALAAGGLGVAASLVRNVWVRVACVALASLACVVPTMLPMGTLGHWGHGTLAAIAMGVTVLVTLVTLASARLYERDPSPLVRLVLLGVAAAVGGLLMCTGSFDLGKAGLSLAAGVAVAVMVGSAVRPIRRSAGATFGMALVTLSIAAGLLASGRLWSETPLWACLCVVLAPLLAWASRVPPVARRPLWQRAMIGLIAAAIPAAVAVGVEGRKAYVASQAMGSDGYGY